MVNFLANLWYVLQCFPSWNHTILLLFIQMQKLFSHFVRCHVFLHTYHSDNNYDDNKCESLFFFFTKIGSFDKGIFDIRERERMKARARSMNIWCLKYNQSFPIFCAAQAVKGLFCSEKCKIYNNQQFIIEYVCVHKKNEEQKQSHSTCLQNVKATNFFFSSLLHFETLLFFNFAFFYKLQFDRTHWFGLFVLVAIQWNGVVT